MIWSDAVWGVAPMQNEQTIRNRTVSQFPCDTMGVEMFAVLPALANFAVRPLTSLSFAGPQPATEQVISFLHIAGKAFGEKFALWRHRLTVWRPLYFTAVPA